MKYTGMRCYILADSPVAIAQKVAYWLTGLSRQLSHRGYTPTETDQPIELMQGAGELIIGLSFASHSVSILTTNPPQRMQSKVLIKTGP